MIDVATETIPYLCPTCHVELEPHGKKVDPSAVTREISTMVESAGPPPAKSERGAVVAAVPAEGRMEATDTTRWFGFKDDVVVRVRPEGAGSRVDVRSVSRVGRGDVGANAARIRAFLQALR